MRLDAIDILADLAAHDISTPLAAVVLIAIVAIDRVEQEEFFGPGLGPGIGSQAVEVRLNHFGGLGARARRLRIAAVMFVAGSVRLAVLEVVERVSPFGHAIHGQA